MNEFAAASRALAQLSFAAWSRRVRQLRPWRMLLLAAGAALVALLQLRITALAPPGQDGVADRVVTVAPLILPLLLLTATRRSPLRLSTADASWSLTAPGGGRALLARHLLAGPARFALMVLAAGALTRWWAGFDPMWAWQPAAACAVLLLLFGLVACVRHLLALGPAPVRVSLRVAGAAWAVAMLISYASDLPAAAWVRLAPLVRGLAGLLFEPAPGSAPLLLAGLASLMCAVALLIAVADGYQEPADAAARERAGAQEVLRDSHSGQELGAERFRTGVASLRPRSALTGERAVFYRALAQERRVLADRLVMPVLLLAAVAGLMVVAPAYGWVPLLPAVPHLLGEHLVGGVAVERDHHFAQVTGMRTERVLIWANILPVARTAVALEVLWLPQIFSPVVEAPLWWAGVLLAPITAVLVGGAGELAGSLIDPIAARFTVALAVCGLGWTPCAVLLAADTPLPMVVASLAAAAVAVWAGAALAAAPRTPWPLRRPGELRS
ncbi:hypothetical protein FE391_15345 [Nonomuraea sp. KC401]|uniref:hypothetical protein n=1 Tax=unclassified Nonomuraea TaxID=2593643 RepID=UPI0010FD8006|nr:MULTISPECIES: hypothetical protein [unclassified Nonomuraea]NBE93325.1 hypothetical protein [Nonomuraea sp. K271]TLF73486.1 hypothetical protein FE391_15345 [Nonomuraea sp. KC401]